MDNDCLQLLQWKQANDYVLTKEEELLLLELTSRTNDLLEDWLNNIYY
nr:MAG TPA: hypothetical protein [Caudoviricetes sp.]